MGFKNSSCLMSGEAGIDCVVALKFWSWRKQASWMIFCFSPQPRPTREDVGRVPSNDDLVRQLAEIDKVQRQAAGALSPWRAGKGFQDAGRDTGFPMHPCYHMSFITLVRCEGRQQAPQRSETSIESTQRPIRLCRC